MAHYAFLDKNNVVTEVIPGVDENELIEGKTPEQWYSEFRGQRCIRTSYNANIRKNFASVGGCYDETFDAFVSKQPFPSWKLNYTNYQWEAPVARPQEIDGFNWLWSEPNKEWIKVAIPTK
jgi:hypothetical protein